MRVFTRVDSFPRKGTLVPLQGKCMCFIRFFCFPRKGTLSFLFVILPTHKLHFLTFFSGYSSGHYFLFTIFFPGAVLVTMFFSLFFSGYSSGHYFLFTIFFRVQFWSLCFFTICFPGTVLVTMFFH